MDPRLRSSAVRAEGRTASLGSNRIPRAAPTRPLRSYPPFCFSLALERERSNGWLILWVRISQCVGHEAVGRLRRRPPKRIPSTELSDCRTLEDSERRLGLHRRESAACGVAREASQHRWSSLGWPAGGDSDRHAVAVGTGSAQICPTSRRHFPDKFSSQPAALISSWRRTGRVVS
jgi:hypothetical protein